MEYEPLGDGRIPAVGVGTWQLSAEAAHHAVSMALELGYRHVDTAQAYGNERGVGRAISDADVAREAIFVTTKVHPSNRTADDIVDSVRGSLDRLGLERVDLLLIHWPHPLADLQSVMAGLNAAADRGLTSHIGVSNFGRDRLDQARRMSDAPVVTDQVLFHRWWPQRELRRYCRDQDIVLTAYSPLASGGLVDDSTLATIGERYGKTAAQVAIRWTVQHEGVITLLRSTSRQHLAENLDVFDFRLSRAEHDRITRPSYLRTGLAMVRGQLGF